MERFFISHWTMSAPGIQRRTVVRRGVTGGVSAIIWTKAAIDKRTQAPDRSL